MENLVDIWQASEAYSAPQLAKRCVLFALEHCEEIIAQDSSSSSIMCTPPSGSHVAPQGGAAAFAELMVRMVPALRSSLVEDLMKAAQIQAPAGGGGGGGGGAST